MKRWMPFRRATVVAALLVFPALAVHAQDAGPEKPEARGITAAAAFDKLKSLAGEWAVTFEMGDADNHGHEPEAKSKIIFRTTGGGSALVEEQFPGEPHEMVSIYHLDGDDLLMTHYCAAGNQPRMKLDRARSTAEELFFNFDGGTNLDPAKDMHIHEARYVMNPGEPVSSYWTAYQNGEPNHTAQFILNKP